METPECFPVAVVTPSGQRDYTDCLALTVQLYDGQAGFLRGHAPFTALLPAASFTMRTPSGVRKVNHQSALLTIDPQAGAELFTDWAEEVK